MCYTVVLYTGMSKLSINKYIVYPFDCRVSNFLIFGARTNEHLFCKGVTTAPNNARGAVGTTFVCVEVLRPRQPNGVMSSAVSLPNHTFTGQALSSKRLTSIVHILSPETDNCPS